MKKITFRNNFFNKEKTGGETFTKKSQTIPNEAMSIREIMVRYSRGLPIDSKVPVYDEENDLPDMRTLDIIDIHEMRMKAKQEIEELRQKAEQEQKQYEERLLSERQKQQDEIIEKINKLQQQQKEKIS